MIDHTGITVSDFEKSKAFYAAALAPINYTLLLQCPASVTGHSDVVGTRQDVGWHTRDRQAGATRQVAQD